MAEVAVFGVASVLLATIASPVVQKAYGKAVSIKRARNDLNKLKTSIETIQAVLLDAEKQQESSAAVRIWIKRVRDVLYDADDLFDQVATDDMLKNEVNEMNEVRGSCSCLNLIVFNNSIAKKVKGIMKSLDEISIDMTKFRFEECKHEKPKRQDPGLLFVGSEKFIGRIKDIKTIIEVLVAESSSTQQNVPVIAVVGIGGMGKTTLTQLVYNDDEVKKSFDQNRWFACISDTSDDKEVIGKIYHSICKEKYEDLTIIDLQNQIREKIKGMKFLLVLDDVWDDDCGRWQGRMSMLSGGAKGSKVVVTTRSESVARAVGAVETHHLEGLSEEESWDLFKSIVSLTPEQERDSRWTNLGKEIVKKCANVPLAIKSIAGLLNVKNTIQEWESFRNEELPKLGLNHKDEIMPVLKLSYEHLSSNLKHCFAYCSLFPKDHKFDKNELICLWISQGYIKPSNEKQSIQDIGHAYFMDLFRRSFFEMYVDSGTRIKTWKMHDLIHDLAQHVAGEEIIMLMTSSDEINSTRHVSVVYDMDDSWANPHQLQNVNRLRSFLYWGVWGDNSSSCKLSLEKQFANFMSLRALSLARWRIETIPCSISELKHLRYLDISRNPFKSLPDAITKLVNLCTLNISYCEELRALPNHFKKLINLKDLINDGCYSMIHMPPGFEEVTSLQHLDIFSVSRRIDGGQRSKLDVLSGLKLRGKLMIWFRDDTDDWDGVECWQPPVTLEHLFMHGYKGLRIPRWGTNNQASLMPKLTSLTLSACSSVKFLPPFSHLPNLNNLSLLGVYELEYVQGHEEEGDKSPNGLFLPNLKNLVLGDLPKLKGWSRKVVTTPTRSQEENVEASTSTCAPPHPHPQLLSLPSLSKLTIERCPELSHMLFCPNLQTLKLNTVNAKVVHQLLPKQDNPSPSNTTPLSSLKSDRIELSDERVGSLGESFTSLRRLQIQHCVELKQVHLAPSHLNILEDLSLNDCPELELWEENKRGVDWDSLPKLTRLYLSEVPSSEKLPDCLQLRQELGKLTIKR